MIASSSIYGEALLNFAELLQQFTYFNMVPSINDNYTVVPYSGYAGYDANFQVPLSGLTVPVSGFVPYGTYLGVMFNEEDNIKSGDGNLVYTQHFYLWCEESLQPGNFISWGANPGGYLNTYRIKHTAGWGAYGGFTQYELERVVGSDGQGTVASGLSDGSNNYQ